MFQSSIRVGAVAAATVTLQLLVAAGSANAQPTAEQQGALRNNCRSDFMSNCSGVTPGGAEALQCLQRNVAKLSPGCQSAVNALSPRPAPQRATTAPPAAAAPAAPAPAQPPATMPAAAPAAPPAASAPTAEQQAALRQLCGADYMAKCSHVAPASHQALQCLQSHSADLSANCRGALALFSPGSAPQPVQAATPASAPARAATPAPAPAARPAAAAAPTRPTAQQQSAIRQSCQGDFMSKCSGVQPGGADALRCLQRNSAQLSPNCRSAVAAIGGGGTAAAAASAAPAAAATAPAAMPTPEQQAAIKRTCQRDFMMNCRGVQPGGPEAFACLQRNASRLSPDCRTSLATVAGGAPATASASTAPAAAQPAAGFRPVGPLRRAIRERMMSQ
jgi:hypothetical protein